ncbi:hypothetical protein SCHPADRAFT_910029 [Schizopora paradoxa]|uniref:Uncharacterized protein n=1 Tax=Schizopora paradoxa TaxID=27342 RepID=A0A0H2R4Q0_9AGAM|nr:hypothetical protein SCHPADRAFT_910691 [Schizopora paradoxa]KLO06819.1 hypothetical protein SCHPADRAFT_910029 [Schizopora paradoxa]
MTFTRIVSYNSGAQGVRGVEIVDVALTGTQLVTSVQDPLRFSKGSLKNGELSKMQEETCQYRASERPLRT